MRYHINAKGDPGQCKASIGDCPFGGADEHFTSKEEASAHYENEMKTFHESKIIAALSLSEASRYAESIAKKNGGDRAEPMIVAKLLVTGKFHDELISEVDFSGNHYVITDSFPNHQIFIAQPNGNLTQVYISSSYLFDAFDAISHKKTDATSEAQVLNQLGFSPKRRAKAESWSKADTVIKTSTGKRYGVSIKSDLGSPATITGASKESRLTVALVPPPNMSREEFQRVLNEVSQLKDSKGKTLVPGKTLVRELTSRGIRISKEKSYFASDSYRRSLQEISPKSEEAMKDMIVSYVAGEPPSKALEEERANLFKEYATNRNTTGLVEEEKRATHFAAMKTDGTVESTEITTQLFKDGKGGLIKIEAASSKLFIGANEERLPKISDQENVAYFPFATVGRMK